MDLRDIESLPNWLEKRYSILWKAFKGKEFERSQAVDLLKERSGDDERSVTSILSELRN